MDTKETMRTTFAAREFTDEPVPDEIVHSILEHARFAPSGGNRQGWHAIIIRDQAMKNGLADLARTGMKRYPAQVKNGENPWNTIHSTSLTQEQIDRTEIPDERLEVITSCPVLLAIAVDLGVVASMDKDLERVGVISGASIYPFVWNVILMARELGYGGALTTFVAAEEAKAQKLLELPEHYAVSALVPIGKPPKQLTKLTRKPVEEIASLETFSGKRFSLNQ